MTDTNFASLSSGLLARKGGAKPAMRPQVSMMPIDGATAHNLEDLGWNDMGEDCDSHRESTVLHLTPEPSNPDADAEAKHNDKVAQAELAEQRAAEQARNKAELQERRKPAVIEQQEMIARTMKAKLPSNDLTDDHSSSDIAESASKPAASTSNHRRRSALSRGKRAAFTLRLDAERHLKLRLACTLRNSSAQRLVTQALDRLLQDMPDVSALAKQAKSTD